MVTPFADLTEYVLSVRCGHKELTLQIINLPIIFFCIGNTNRRAPDPPDPKTLFRILGLIVIDSLAEIFIKTG